MTDAETRVLARTAAVLLVVSMVRFGWEARRGPAPLAGDGRDDGPALLAESRRLAAENDIRSRPLGPGERIDPNRATEVELDRLPGVGPGAARAIVAAREQGGGFATVDDLLRVAGIGDATLARMRPHLEIRGVPPGPVRRPGTPGRDAPAEPPTRSRPPSTRPALDLNRATTAELERISGIGPALAARIVEERTRRGAFGSVDDLLRVRGIGPATLERLRPLVRVGGP